MKLYYKAGACSMASHIILNELGLSFDLELVDTEKGTTNTGTQYNSVNPNGYVPSLELDDGQILTENIAVLQYLADSNQNLNLIPAENSFERNRLQELLSFLATELQNAYGPFFSGKELNSVDRKDAEEKIAALINHLEMRLSDNRDFLMGQYYTVADAYAFVILNWSNYINFPLHPWPKTNAFIQRILNRPATKKTMLTEKLTEPEAA